MSPAALTLCLALLGAPAAEAPKAAPMGMTAPPPQGGAKSAGQNAPMRAAPAAKAGQDAPKPATPAAKAAQDAPKPAKPTPKAADDDPHAGHNHGPGGHGHPARHTGPTTQDPSGLKLWMSFRVIAVEGGDLYLGVNYNVINQGEAAFRPDSHGLLLPVPQGNKNVSLARGSRGAKVVKQGILVTQMVQPGRHGVQVSANVKFKVDKPTLEIRIGSAIPLLGYSASHKAYPGVRIEGQDLGKPSEFDASSEHGGKYRMYRSLKASFPRTSLSFQITGLPVRSRSRSLPFGLAALLLLLAGIVLAVLHARRVDRRTGVDTAAAEAPVETLLRLERDRRLGLIDEATHESERQQVLDAAASRK